ncbi:formate dehydrogenase 2 [Candida albicans L26]|uniref:Formate dehydrogenase n=4 Tax=Candida albicans TaxID=5476 RepID=Q59QN6_CANAL|nr:formate dehydrogenase (NAD+) [Candida albicans SC5314]EEQ43608.1 formate dehydrogenase [Candida albicans WO-1]KAF6066853.1 Formate dehydrogenase 1 [Candida albicans]KGQ81843.1 formate dehydrogenase 2 [Candida albicans P94015]KGQ82522.1 formate dehydrogenase 2 [Candida albicans GC75]KGQ83116.1 formate dehydrogenase 1 [Candida albicans P37005]KGR02250.1 formate dehydrogenase 2 [Candida albicans P78048]KGR06001.1 formate dehydrogenase 2 [Candida albicans P37037]KGT63752.1 formate dehydrogen|eukprot:XP_711984.1 formate dehydrogenase (NAD+) [Candida albicans SC5314]
MGKPKVLMVLYAGGNHAKEETRLLGTVENELGIRKLVEEHGYELVTTTDKEPAPTSAFDENLEDAEIIITTPFFPAYVNKERIAKAPKLKLCITAGVGSDHYDLDALNERGIAAIEVTGSNVVSVAEHAVMTMLILIRNYGEGHAQATKGTWDVAAVAKDEFDLEDKVIATVGAGRIGYRILERLVAFNPKKLLYYDYQPLPEEAINKLNAASKLFNGVDNIVERVEKLEDLVSQADVVTINCPLYEKSRGLFNKDLISKMKKGSYLVNTARGAIVDPEAVADAVNSGHIAYGGDVWPVQPAPKDMPWRTMHNPYGEAYGNAMTLHVSGTSLDAQARYANGVKQILTEYFNKTYNYRPQDVIVIDGDYATKAYGQREKK